MIYVAQEEAFQKVFQQSRIIAIFGFALVSIRGSHQKWYHPALKKTLIIPVHHGDCDSVYKIYVLKRIVEYRIHILFPL